MATGAVPDLGRGPEQPVVVITIGGFATGRRPFAVDHLYRLTIEVDWIGCFGTGVFSSR
ncbi:hypothetical protein ACFWPK_15100 [Nocardia sp. NPDC058519]|uniref:hypothetical protein n=1 Tax=Nocardia sp. NPDC058519 TaxID=3346535 RepID=UPI00365F546B